MKSKIELDFGSEVEQLTEEQQIELSKIVDDAIKQIMDNPKTPCIRKVTIDSNLYYLGQYT